MSSDDSTDRGLDDLVDHCIALWKTNGPSAIDIVCRQNPNQAAAIRARLRILQRTGSLRSTLGHDPGVMDLRSEPTKKSYEFPFTIGRFEVEAELGAGSTGVVFRARDTILGRDVAVKLLYADLQRDSDRLNRFRREAKILASLNHPNIASIYDLEEHRGDIYLVLEYATGKTLEACVRDVKPPYVELLRWLVQIARALEAAHERDIIHRDLKPANVMIDPSGTVKVLDFGLAQQIRVNAGDEVPLDFAGTPRYMSPEQWSLGHVDSRSDIWAFGCILFEVLSGCFPFRGDHADTVRTAVLDEDPRWEVLPPAVPHRVRELIASCLQKERDDRPRRARDCRETLDRIVSEMESEPSLTVQCLRRKIGRGERAAFRVWASNPGPATLSARVSLETGVDYTDTESTTVSIATGDVWHAVLRARPAGVGSIATPTARMEIDSDSHRADELGDHQGSPIHSVVSPTTLTVDSAKPAALIGRDDLIETITRAIERSVDGTPTLIALHGTRGSGKSTLLQRAGTLARAKNLRELRAFGSGGYRQPLKIFHDLLRDLTGISEFEERGESLRRHAERRLSEYLRHDPSTVDFFVKLLVDDNSHTPGLELRQYHWYRLLAAAASDEPLLLAIDDIHEADEHTLQLLASLARRFRQEALPVGILVTISTAGTDRTNRLSLNEFLKSDGLASEVHGLPPLRPSAISEAIDAMYPGACHQDAMPWLGEVIWERTEGNPAFIEEVLGTLGTAGSGLQLFERAAVGWTPKYNLSRDRIASSIPIRYVDVIEEQLSALGRFEQDLLEAASLVGCEFPTGILEGVFGDSKRIDVALDELGRAQLITHEDNDLSRCRFRSRLVQDVARERLLGRGRRVAARRCLEIAEVACDMYLAHPEHMEWIGRLFFDGGEHPRASLRLLEALHWRTERGEYADALSIIDRLDQVHGCMPNLEPEIEVDLEIRRATVLAMLGRLDEATAATRLALEIARDFEVVRLQARALIQLSELQQRSSQWDEAATSIDRALELLDPEDSELTMAALNNQGILYLNRGAHAEARRVLHRVLTQARADTDRRVEVKALNNLGIVDYREGDLSAARESFRRAVALSDRLGSVGHATISRVWLSNVEFERGNLDAASRGYAEAIPRFRMLQNRRGLARNHGNLALVQRLQGRLDLAIDSVETALRLSLEVGDRGHEATWKILLADLFDLLGAGDRAIDQADQAAALAIELEDESLIDRARVTAYELRLRYGLDRNAELAIGSDQPAADVAALRLLVGMAHFGDHDAREPNTDAKRVRMIADVEACLPRLSVESGPLRTRLTIATARILENVQTGTVRLEQYLATLNARPELDEHRVHGALAAMHTPHDPERAREASARFDKKLSEAAARIADLELRAQYVDSERSEP